MHNLQRDTVSVIFLPENSSRHNFVLFFFLINLLLQNENETIVKDELPAFLITSLDYILVKELIILLDIMQLA